MYIDPTGHAPLLNDLTKSFQASANSANQSAMQFRNQSSHSAAGAIEVGAGTAGLASGVFGAANLMADAFIDTGANIGEFFGANFSHSATVNEARQNLRSTEQTLLTGLGKWGSRDGRSELGTPLVEWAVAFANGSSQAAQQLTNTATQIGLGSIGVAEVAALKTAKLKTNRTVTSESSQGQGSSVGQRNVDSGNSVSKPVVETQPLNGNGSYSAESDFGYLNQKTRVKGAYSGNPIESDFVGPPNLTGTGFWKGPYNRAVTGGKRKVDAAWTQIESRELWGTAYRGDGGEPKIWSWNGANSPPGIAGNTGYTFYAPFKADIQGSYATWTTKNGATARPDRVTGVDSIPKEQVGIPIHPTEIRLPPKE